MRSRAGRASIPPSLAGQALGVQQVQQGRRTERSRVGRGGDSGGAWPPCWKEDGSSSRSSVPRSSSRHSAGAGARANGVPTSRVRDSLLMDREAAPASHPCPHFREGNWGCTGSSISQGPPRFGQGSRILDPSYDCAFPRPPRRSCGKTGVCGRVTPGPLQEELWEHWGW